MKKQIINATYIRSFQPCQDGIENFEKHYPNWEGKIEDLLRLEDISYSHKVWLVVKVCSEATLKQWSVECAEHVLELYEGRYPGDMRVRECLEATKLFLDGKITEQELREKRSAAHAAYAAAAKDQEDINLSLLIAIIEGEGDGNV
jgi:hypothetical protein